MKICLDVPEYDPHTGLKLVWENNFVIDVEVTGDQAIISANSEGLVSLARHLLLLAQPNVPAGHHIHLDELNALEDGPFGIIFQRR